MLTVDLNTRGKNVSDAEPLPRPDQDRITELLLGEFSIQEIRGLHPEANRILNRLINREYDKHGISRMTPEMFGGFREVMNELWSPGLTTVLNTLSKRQDK
jgi:hypothetical protein